MQHQRLMSSSGSAGGGRGFGGATRLRKLCLRANRLGPPSTAALCRALPPTLAHLDLSHNAVSARELAFAPSASEPSPRLAALPTTHPSGLPVAHAWPLPAHL